MSGVGFPALAVAQPGVVPDAPETDAPEMDSGATTRAAILPLVIEGDPMPEADRKGLAGRLVEGLRRGDFDVVEPDDVAAAAPAAATCQDAACYSSIAQTTGASHVVRAVVTANDRDYTVHMVLADGDTGVEVASADDSCQICGVAEVGDLVDAAAATLRTKLDALGQGPATLLVSSEPKGAQVFIDGELKGTTPFDAPVLPGKHILRVSQAGYITVERETTFVEGIEESQSFVLEKVPSRLPGRPWGWVSLGGGIAGLGVATAFAVLGQQEFEFGPSCDETDAQGNCPEIWNTELIVLGTAIGGAALTTLGVAILLSSSRRGNKASVDEGATASTGQRWGGRGRPRIGFGPGSVTLSGRF